MGLLSSLLSAQTYDRSPGSDYWYQPVGSVTQAGMQVSKAQMFTVSSVLQGVRFPSQTVAGLPRFIFRTLPDGTKQKERDHPLNRVLRFTPNPWQTSFQFVESMTARAIMDGIAVAQKFYDDDTLRALVPVEAGRIAGIDQAADGRLRYRIRDGVGASARDIMQENLFVLVGFGAGILKDFSGLPISQYMRETAGLELALERYGANFFANSAMPRVVLSSPNPVQEETRQRMKADWQRSYGNSGQHGTALLEDGTKVDVLSTKNDEAQFNESRAFLIGEFSRFLDVTPHRMHDLRESSYNNVEQMSLESVVYSLTPWVERWEQTCYRDLLSSEDRDADRYVKFVLEGLLRGDTAARGDFYSKGVFSGWLLRNEIREKEDMNPIDGLSEPLEPQNMIPAGTPRTPAAQAPTQPAATGQPTEGQQQQAARMHRIARAAAVKCVERELERLEAYRLRRNGDNGEAWARLVRQFYCEHAEFISRALALDPDKAREWCSSRCTAVLENGQSADFEAIVNALTQEAMK